MRVELIVELWNRLTLPDSRIMRAAEKVNLDSQMLVNGKTLWELLEKGRIKPLVIDIEFESQSEENYRFMKMFEYYSVLSKWKQYPQIISYTIQHSDMSLFWNFNKTSQPGRYL